jgi:hypothetical protein
MPSSGVVITEDAIPDAIADPDYGGSNFHCCAEWHLARLPCGRAAPVYTFAQRISHNSRRFSCSAVSVARYFDVHRTTILRAYHCLSEIGFFVLLEYGKFDTNLYMVVSHQEWAKANPGKCVQKLKFAWTGEGDPLAIKLYAASGGRVKFMDFQVAEYRKTGFDEEKIVALFQEFREGIGKYRQARNVGLHFLKHLRRIQRTDPTTII